MTLLSCLNIHFIRHAELQRDTRKQRKQGEKIIT